MGTFSFKAKITIPSGTVNANLTDFPVMLRLSDLPASFWDNVRSDGGDIRVKTTGDVQIPQDLARFDFTDKDGVLFFKDDLATGSDNEWYFYSGDPFLEKLADDNANGRNAVWADYDAVMLLGETRLDRTGKGNYGTRTVAADTSDDVHLFEKGSITGDLDAHQGLCWGGGYYFVVDTNKITKYNESWVQQSQNTDPIGDTGISGVDHCGDPEYYDGKIYIPIELYPNDPYNNQHIAVFDASDLSFIESFDISAQAHEACSCCYNHDDGLFYVASYTDGTKLWKYDPANGFSYEGTITLGASVTYIQGVVYWHGAFWITTDTGNRLTYRFDPSGDNCGEVFPNPTTNNFEGITKRYDELLVLVDLGSTEEVRKWKPYDITNGAGGGAEFFGLGELTYGSRPSRTTLTLGVTFAISSKAQNRCALSYWDESAGTTNTRVGIAYSTSQASIGVWDVNNSWLLPSPAIDPTLDQIYRVNVTYNGTTDRKIYIDGVLKNTDLVITLLPNALDALRIGSEDTSLNERFSGLIGFVYLRSGVLSADWLAAEYDNISDPGAFYSIEHLPAIQDAVCETVCDLATKKSGGNNLMFLVF